MPARECSRTACSRPAVSTLTFVYEDSTAVLGPLARTSEPNTYDLCSEHAGRMTAPRGWELLRIAGASEVPDDLVALADALRSRPAPAPGAPGQSPANRERGSARESRSGPTPRPQRGGPSGAMTRNTPRHLRVLRSEND